MEIEESEWKKLLSRNEELTLQLEVLQESMKNVLKENTMLKVDISVLKDHINKLEKAPKSNEIDAYNIAQQRLDYKTKENEQLIKKIGEHELVIEELQKYSRKYNEVEKENKENKKEIGFLKQSIKTLQEQNEQLKKESK